MLFEPSLLATMPIDGPIDGSIDTPLDLETKSSDAEPEAKPSPAPLRARRTTSDRVREAVIMLAEGRGELITHEERAWNSITFSGTRHEIVLEFCGTEDALAGEDFIASLPDHEFTIPGQLVADATVREVDHRFGAMERMQVTCVLLLLEES